MANVWVARARYEFDEEGNVVGLYTSRRKAKRAVLDYFGMERGRWEKPEAGQSYEPLESECIEKATEQYGCSGSVVQWPIR